MSPRPLALMWSIAFSALAQDAGVEFRPFEAQRVPQPAAPLAQTRGCLEPDAALEAKEQERRAEHLARALAKRGAAVLRVERVSPPLAETPGTLVRGPLGQRWLVLPAEAEPGALVVLERDGTVAQTRAWPKVKTRRVVRLCHPLWCAGGGRLPPQPPPASRVVEVPEGAHLGAAPDVSYPLEVAVELMALDARGAPLPCLTPP